MAQRPLDYWLLWVVALVSLGLNLALINTLSEARTQVGVGAQQAARAVGQVRAASITYTVQIDQSLPVSATVPFYRTFRVPVNEVFRIDTVVNVPFQTPLGTFPIAVPLQTSVPISFEVTVPIEAEIPVFTVVPVNLDIPVVIRIRETELGAALLAAENFLEEVGTSLSDTPPPTPTPRVIIGP